MSSSFCFASSKTSSLLCSTTLASVIVVIVMSSAVVTAAPVKCKVSQYVTAANVRSTDDRGVLIKVEGDWTNVGNGLPPDAGVIKALNGNMTSASGKIQVEGAFVFNNSVVGSAIAVTFKRVTDYWLPGTNDTVTLRLPNHFFKQGKSCGNFTFKILSAAGQIDSSFVPLSVPETKINAEDVTFDVYVMFDRFLTADVWFVNPAGFTVITSLPFGTKSNQLRVTVRAKPDYNPPVGHVDKLVLIFHKSMMQSGVAPRVGDGFSVFELAVNFVGVMPKIEGFYKEQKAMLSEDLWDGTAWAFLVLEGDTFVLNESLWLDPVTQPKYAGPTPKTASMGFENFLDCCKMRPNFTITNRTVNLTFPALVGFTIPSSTDKLRILGIGAVTTEKQDIGEFLLRVVQVAPTSPTVTWTGTDISPFNGTGVNEVDVRRSGFSISIVLKYNVWVSTPDPSSVLNMIRSESLGTSTLLSFVGMTARVVNRTRLILRIPAQINYDISADEIFNISIIATLTETRMKMVNNSILFPVRQFTGSATCALYRDFFIKETDIRNASAPPIVFRIDIAYGTDRFCFTPQATQDLRNSFLVATGAGNPSMSLDLVFLGNTSTNISIQIRHDPVFEITGNVFLSMTIPANLMCSFEKCLAQGGGGKLLLPIGAVAGVLLGVMPRVPESWVRTMAISGEIEFVGDEFVIGASGGTRGTIPVDIPTVNPVDTYGRGFLSSYEKRLLSLTIDNNMTRAVFTLPPNASYDIVVEECIYITIVSKEAASKLPPMSYVAPLCIYPESSFITVLYPNMTIPVSAPPAPLVTATADPNATTTEGNTTTTTSPSTTTTTTTSATSAGPTTTNANGTANVTTAAPTAVPLQPWIINVTEKQIQDGNLTINMTLTNDRWDIVNMPAVVRAQIVVLTPVKPGGVVPNPSGIQANKAVALADSAFFFSKNEFFVSIRWRRAPGYDITEPEAFLLVFDKNTVIARADPAQFEIRVYVRPEPGVLTMSGPAVLISSFDIVNGFQTYSISIEGDKFIEGAEAVFERGELCVVTAGQCAVKMDKSRRNITVTYDAFPSFFISRNESWVIPLRRSYFDSGEIPVGQTTVTVYLSGGKLEWFFQTDTVTEDMVREGDFLSIGLAQEAPIATAKISGDKFATKEEVRKALAESVVCTSADKTLQGNDPYGFCSRALALLGSVFFRIDSDGTLLKIVLQPDEDFDIYANELVRFVIGGLATSSRLPPFVPGKQQGTFTITPTAGTYSFRSLPSILTEQDLSVAALATRVLLSITLVGERWLSNTTRAVEVLVSSLTSSRGSREVNGWDRYRDQILPAKTAGRTDATQRSLDLQFIAVPRYNIFNEEIITVEVPAAAVLSGTKPNRHSRQEFGTFTIDIVGGILIGSPATVDQNVIKTTGLNITLQVRQTFWNTLAFLEYRNIEPMFSTNKVPQEEPNGFAVYRAEMLKRMNPGGAIANTTHVFLEFNMVPQYALIAPEIIRIDVKKEFTQLSAGSAGKDLTPSFFEFRVMPEFPLVDAVVYSKEVNLTSGSPEAIAWLQNWRRALAEKLAVTAPRIEIDIVAKEWMIPETAPYYRIRFRVKAEDPTVPYDNKFTRLFVSMKREFLEEHFNTSFAFFNSTTFADTKAAPKRAEWLSLEGAGGTGAREIAAGANWIFVLFFILAVGIVLLIVVAYRRYTQGKDKNGLNWGESKGRQDADAKFDDNHEMEEHNFDLAAELLFTGQRQVLPYLADDAAAASAQEQARLNKQAAKHGVLREQTVTQQGVPSAAGYHTKTLRPTADGRDELAFFDVPENAYCGQKSVTKRATDADVGLSLIERMEMEGTDHSSRIARAGTARINLVDVMGRPVVSQQARSNPAHEFKSPLELKQKDPTLFGSEERIGNLLDRVAPRGSGANTGFMTDLRRELMHDTQGKDPVDAQKARQWNDAKADDVVLPPHLVGKVARFKPAERR